MIETLYGNGAGNDAPALRAMLKGGCAYDYRDGGNLISANTIAALPAGLYRLVDPVNPEVERCGRAA